MSSGPYGPIFEVSKAILLCLIWSVIGSWKFAKIHEIFANDSRMGNMGLCELFQVSEAILLCLVWSPKGFPKIRGGCV